MTLSIPYLENHMVLVVPTDSTYQTMDDLAGKNIALQSGSTAQEEFDAEAQAQGQHHDDRYGQQYVLPARR